VKLSDIHPNPKNPRRITQQNAERLIKSIEQLPEMMNLRPIVVDENGVILGGNMRFLALKKARYKEIPDDWVKRADQLTEAQKREFVIKDNSNFGEYDWDLLANEWDDLPLADWGVDVPEDWAGPGKEPVEPQEKPEVFEEKSEELKKFIAAREESRERGNDKMDANFWLCLVFQSWAQKVEFLKKIEGVPTLYGMYVDGQTLAGAVGIEVTPNEQKPHLSPLEKRLSDLVGTE